MTASPLNHPDVTLTWDLENVEPVSTVEYYTKRRLTILPRMLEVRFAQWHEGMSVYIEGRIIRQSDGQLGYQSSGIAYQQVPTWKHDNSLEDAPNWILPYLDIAEAIIDGGLHPEGA